MAAAGAMMGVIGMGFGINNAIQEANLKEAANDFNAKKNEEQAQLTLSQSAEDERRARIQSQQALGDMRANYSASGVTLEGSPLDALRFSAENAELDALTIRHQGDVKAWAYRNNATLDKFESAASSALLPGRIGMAVTSMGSQMGNNYAMTRR